MVRFQNKTHLILWLEKNCARKAIVRALYEGEVEFFGGFDPIHPTKYPGWILGITTAHGKIFYVAVIAYDRRYGIRILRDVPWGNWMGTSIIQHGPWTPLFNGDNPREYARLKEIWDESKTI